MNTTAEMRTTTTRTATTRTAAGNRGTSARPGSRRAGTARPVSLRGGDVGAALELLDRARAMLGAAGRSDNPAERYIDAHLAAMRAAAALIAARGGMPRRGSVWVALRAEAPELEEWADHFEVCAQQRRRVEAALWVPSRGDSEGLLASVETFLTLVQAALGIPVASGLPALSCPALAPAA